MLRIADTPPDTGRALMQVRARIDADRGIRRPLLVTGGYGGPQRRRWLAPAAGLVAAAVLAASLVLTPAGSLAQSFITIFEPRSVAPLQVSTADLQDLRNLPNLSAFGTMRLPTAQLARVPDRAAAERATGLTVVTPASRPSGVPASVTYMVLPRGTASFTFSARKVAAATAHGKALPSLPRELDGSTLQVTAGPAAAAFYGGDLSGATVRSGDPLGALPTLVIAQSAVPQVGSTGASVATIEDYLLRLPGVTSHLAQQIRAIGHPASTLPIPIPLDFTQTQTVRVQGVQGLAVGDETGLGSGVIWEQGGEVYGVAGTLPESQIIAIANSLR